MFSTRRLFVYSRGVLLRRHSLAVRNCRAFSSKSVPSAVWVNRTPFQRIPSVISTPVSPLTSIFRSYADLPQHNVVDLPALSPTMSQGTLVSWDKKEGEEVRRGDVVAQVETDKATMDMEAPRHGFIAKFLVGTGTKDILLGTPLFVLVDKAEDVSKFKDYKTAKTSEPAPSPAAPSKPTPSPQPASPPPQPTPPPATPREQVNVPPGRIFASPYAKTLAAEKGLDLATIKGSGPSGRVVSKDVLAAQATGGQPTAGATYTDIELSNMRKTIASRLQQAKQTIPHYYLTVDIIMDDLLKLRTELNGYVEQKLSVTDFLIKAAALAMAEVPEVNSSWMGDFIRQYHNVDVSVAVSTEGGLITPIVVSAETKGLKAINANMKDLAERARLGKLKPHEFQGGTFTISNLGMFGIKQFTAVINPPQSCILAVGKTEKRVIVDEGEQGSQRVANVMTVTLSCDHRVVDGAVGAKWLGAFKSLLERPFKMLL
ncbi:hypothetical protein EMCRGX_G014628 [Ephydatia muelleri]|eukprot:Em0005g1346a